MTTKSQLILGIMSGTSIEPAAFALLAWQRINRRPGNLPQTTGASRALPLGQVTEV